MTAHDPDMDPAEAILAELAGLDLTLARHVHACALASDDPQVVASLAQAYQRAARSVRLTLAQHARFKRERLGGEASEDPPAPSPATRPPPDTARMAERRRALRKAIGRVIRAERETETDREELFERLEARLERHRGDPTFGLKFYDGEWTPEPLDDHLVGLCRGLGIPDDAALAWRDLPDDDEDGRHGPTPPRARESSA